MPALGDAGGGIGRARGVSCQTRVPGGANVTHPPPGRLERQRAAEDREGPRITGEVVSPDDVGEAQPPVQPPGAVGFAVDLRGREQHVRLAASGQQPSGQCLAEAPALGMRMDVQLGQLEVAAYQAIDLIGWDADVQFTVAFPGEVTSTNGERVDSDVVQWTLKPGVVSTMSAQARFTDPSTRSFTGAALWLGLAALVVAGVIGTLAWVNRDQSPRFAG